MYIALRVRSEVGEERVGATHCRVEVVVERGIVHEQSECTVVAVELGGELLYIIYGLVNLAHCSLDVESGEVGCQLVGVVEYSVGLGHHHWYALVERSHELVEFGSRSGEVAGDGLYVV